jgi:hypothetical protein
LRPFHLLLAVLLGTAASYATTVSIAQPSTSTSTSPVAVSATVTGSSSVLQLYVDGQKYSQVHDATLTTSLDLTEGTHRIAVQSIDSNHVITKSVKYVTVSSSPGTTFSNLQESSNWQTCGNCGNTGGTGTTAPYTMTRGLTSPAIDSTSTSAEFWIGGSTPYTNGYWYLRDTAAKAPVKKLLYDFYLYVPSQFVSAPQAIEFQCQQTVNGYTYNYAWQADYPTHTWRTFDYVNRRWVGTTIAFPGFSGNTWHHIIAEYHAEGATTVHDALTVDGVRYSVGVVHAAKATTQTWASFSNAFQLDLNKYATDYSVYIDKMKVTYW